ncbi:hypothetical protein FRB99_000962 [Tulasnella sp. 403]|nr:hypothetical protein FRB99_000962 [Tulasnella sp. 403]
MKRKLHLPPLKQSPAHWLDESTRVKIDGCLKVLRKVHRSCPNASLAEELQLLERFYYKNNNSQRPTVEWRKLKELRRIADRVREIKLNEFLHLGFSAFVESGTNRKKQWSHTPSISYLVSIVSRTRAIHQLSLHGIRICHAVYAYVLHNSSDACPNTFLGSSAYAGTLGTTGYIAIATVVMSLAARICRIMQEHSDACAAVSHSILEIIEALQPGASQRYFPVHTKKPGRETKPVLESSQQADDIDLGERIERPPAMANATPTAPLEPVFDVNLNDTAIPLPPRPSTPDLSIPPPTKIKLEPSRKPQKAKKASKRDEIDEIFGF